MLPGKSERRVYAFIIDISITMGVIPLLYIAIENARLLETYEFISSNLLMGFIAGFQFIFSLFYFSLFESSILKATPGKLVVGLQVTDIEGERINFPRSIVRFLLKSLFLFPHNFVAVILPPDIAPSIFMPVALAQFVLTVISFLYMDIGKNKQALHDIWPKTKVSKRF